jgi:hypothetical protein
MPIRVQIGYKAYPAELYSVVREILHVIGDIDQQFEGEINETDRNLSDEEVKNRIKQKIRAAHQTKRQPYIDLLSTLRLPEQSP